MLEGKDYRSVAMMFLFGATFVYRSTGHDEHAYLAGINTRYFHILNRISDDSGLSGCMDNGGSL